MIFFDDLDHKILGYGYQKEGGVNAPTRRLNPPPQIR